MPLPPPETAPRTLRRSDGWLTSGAALARIGGTVTWLHELARRGRIERQTRSAGEGGGLLTRYRIPRDFDPAAPWVEPEPETPPPETPPPPAAAGASPEWIGYDVAAERIGCSHEEVLHLVRRGWLRGTTDLAAPARVRAVDALAWAPAVPGRYHTLPIAAAHAGRPAALVLRLAEAGLVRVHRVLDLPPRFRWEDLAEVAHRPEYDPAPERNGGPD